MAPLWSSDDRGWRDAEFVALDFETTSGDPRRAEPLSVGWVVVAGGRVRLADAAYHVIDHAGDVPVASLQIHRLTPADLADGRDLDDVAMHLRAALDGRIVVAHGGWIERALLRRLGAGRPTVVDTLAVVRRLDARAGRETTAGTLAAVARRHRVPVLRAHHACGDALTTALLLLVLAGDLERRRGHCSVDDLVRLGRH